MSVLSFTKHSFMNIFVWLSLHLNDKLILVFHRINVLILVQPTSSVPKRMYINDYCIVKKTNEIPLGSDKLLLR